MWGKSLLVAVVVCLTAFVQAESAQSETSFVKKCPSGLVVTMNLPDDSLETFQPVEAVITLSDKERTPRSQARIFCSLFMPSVATGNNRPVIKETSTNGQYTGSFLFTNPGQWQTELTINLPSGIYESVTFNLGEIQSPDISSSK
ncbi:MAG: hypothetical protein C0616_11930 [Desulfuromonas sp.]|nr:MAG: hypothetical protein C0616_11930 [Desulfuromonas sp.]